MSHTPGPWEVGGSGILVWHGSTIVADMWPDIEEAEAIVPREEAGANANLIAAAPELLKALGAILDWDEGEGRLGEHLTQMGCAALRKAAGDD